MDPETKFDAVSNIMAAQLTAEHRVACMIGSMNLENRFCNVETND